MIMMQNKNHEELLALSAEAKELSMYIAGLKRKAKKTHDENKKAALREEVKLRQFQALFYMDKMKNLTENYPAGKTKKLKSPNIYYFNCFI